MIETIDIKTIKVGIKISTKEEVLKQISKIAFENGIVKSENSYFEGLLERESECTTGFGNGFAVPHCKSSTVNRAAVIICKLDNEVEWKSMDDKPVNFILALAVPELEADTTHIKILSQIARGLMNEEFTEKLKKANSETDIYNLLYKELKGGK